MSFGESHHSKSHPAHPAHPGTHILWPTLIKTPLQYAHCISNTLALICFQWDPTHSAQSPSLCPHCALRLDCSVVLGTWTQTFVPKALLWVLWYEPFRLYSYNTKRYHNPNPNPNLWTPLCPQCSIQWRAIQHSFTQKELLSTWCITIMDLFPWLEMYGKSPV